jgi:hypothetical protein
MAGPWRNTDTSTGGNNPPCGTGTQSSFCSVITIDFFTDARRSGQDDNE